MRFASIILTALVSICAVASPLPLDNSVNGGAAVVGFNFILGFICF